MRLGIAAPRKTTFAALRNALALFVFEAVLFEKYIAERLAETGTVAGDLLEFEKYE